MADIFLSYSRTDKPRVAPLVAALEAQGWSVWWDSALAPGEEFDQVTSAELDRCKAVVVVWTPVSVASRWVRGEARVGADRGVLVPIRFGNAQLPIDVRAIQTTDFDDWKEDVQSVAFQRLVQSLRTMTGNVVKPAAIPAPMSKAADRPKQTTIFVLPLANMSGEPEQEYFSDGISEDVITDLGKISAISVISRNTAFGYKGKAVDLKQIALQLGVTHVLEGSVRKFGNRVRITAQLIEAASDNQVWGERFDRDLSDIFALQDEISQAIAKALKLKLAPAEKKAIEQRGTTNVEAYNLYLMARQYSVASNFGDARRSEAIIRLCESAIALDSKYAQAWSLLAITQGILRFHHGQGGDAGLAAAAQAIALDPALAEAHAAKARALTIDARREEAAPEVAIALRLDPESYEVNIAAGAWHYAMRQALEAAQYLDKAAALMETDYWASGMAMAAYATFGDKDSVLRVARRTLARTEKIVASEPANGSAAAFFTGALATLGENERAKSVAKRATLLDPNNQNMRYNLSCVLISISHEYEAGLDLLEPMFDTITLDAFNWAKVDGDFDPIREHPRFKAMMAKAAARLGGGTKALEE